MLLNSIVYLMNIRRYRMAKTKKQMIKEIKEQQERIERYTKAIHTFMNKHISGYTLIDLKEVIEDNEIELYELQEQLRGAYEWI